MGIITKQEPVLWDMTVYINDTWPAWNFDLVDDSNSPLSNFTVLMQVRREGLGRVFKELSAGNGFTVVAGNVKFNTTVNLQAGRYKYDIQITLTNGEKHTQYFGTINAIQDISI